MCAVIQPSAVDLLVHSAVEAKSRHGAAAVAGSSVRQCLTSAPPLADAAAAWSCSRLSGRPLRSVKGRTA